MYDFLRSIELYDFLKGPMVWISFFVFISGSVYRIFFLLYKVKKSKIIREYMNLKYSFRSIFHWIIPFASTNMRKHPLFTIMAFLFHICLFVTPIFLNAHNKLLFEAWQVKLWSIPEILADYMSLIVIFCIFIFFLRRIVVPEVKYVTYGSDYLLLLITGVPFITGFLASRQLLLDYPIMLNLHIAFSELMLISIPFTRLSHMLFFWFIRAYTGSDFGAVRHSKDY